MKNKTPLLIAGIWFTLGLIYSGQSFFYSITAGREYILQRSLFHSFLFCLEWGLLTLPVWKLAERFRLDSENILRNLFIHFGLGLTIAFIQHTIYVVVMDAVERPAGNIRTFEQLLPSIIGFVEYGVLMYWSIVFVFHGIAYYRNYQSEHQRVTMLRAQLVEAQLQSLHMQLQPHFLFNALNAIAVLVVKQPPTAKKMLLHLSELLRMSLDRGKDHFVTVAQEMDFVDTYLIIQKLRFGKRLDVSIDVSPDVAAEHIPTFLLQPLIENAVHHGIAVQAGRCWISIQIEQQGTMIQIAIKNGRSSKVKDVRSKPGKGVGLKNTQDRLLQLYGDSHEFSFAMNSQNGADVIVRLPLKSAKVTEGR